MYVFILLLYSIYQVLNQFFYMEWGAAYVHHVLTKDKYTEPTGLIGNTVYVWLETVWLRNIIIWSAICFINFDVDTF